MRSLRSLFLAVLLLFMLACGGDAASNAGDADGNQPAAGGAAPPQPEEPTGDAGSDAPDAPETGASPLLNPDHPDANRTAPTRFRVDLDTSKGTIVIDVHRDWAPRGADRFYNLVTNGYYDGVRFFRVVDGFVAQFGMHGDPAINAAWDGAEIPDDPSVDQTNARGRLTFAHGGPGTRTTQLFINIGDNGGLDAQGFPPFAEIVEGLDVLDSLYNGYGDGPPYGPGPDQGRIGAEGNDYLERAFPNLDYVRTARVVAER